jgi:ABC-type dipeptide/oligopeptide/nickel transport systems, permease components
MNSMVKVLLTSKKFVIGFCLFMTLVLVSIIVPLVNPADPLEMVGLMYEKPSSEYWLGTDNFGRNVLIELVHGMKTSLTIGFIAGIIATFIGTIIGLVAGYFGRNIDNVLNTITNIFLVIPPILILIIISISLESRSLGLMGLILGITSWPWTARAVRAQACSLRAREHVNLAKLNGSNPLEIIFKEILPYIFSYVFMSFILQTAGGILNEAAMSMLGLGPTNVVSLGTMLSWALLFEAPRVGAWWAFLPPAIGITLITFSLYVINTAMDEVFNPKLRS